MIVNSPHNQARKLTIWRQGQENAALTAHVSTITLRQGRVDSSRTLLYDVHVYIEPMPSRFYHRVRRFQPFVACTMVNDLQFFLKWRMICCPQRIRRKGTRQHASPSFSHRTKAPTAANGRTTAESGTALNLSTTCTAGSFTINSLSLLFYVITRLLFQVVCVVVVVKQVLCQR